MQQHRGIVLKRYMPKKQKLSVLDDQLGRIEAVVPDVRMLQRAWPGMVLAYQPQERFGICFLQQAQLVEAPLARARADIQFLHLVLEVCYYFLPLHDVAPEIFKLVLLACSEHIYFTNEHKLLIVAKFFWLIALEIDMLQDNKPIRVLLALPLQSMLKEQVDDYTFKRLHQFITQCIVGHPQRAHFKTISFIPGTGVL